MFRENLSVEHTCSECGRHLTMMGNGRCGFCQYSAATTQ